MNQHILKDAIFSHFKSFNIKKSETMVGLIKSNVNHLAAVSLFFKLLQPLVTLFTFTLSTDMLGHFLFQDLSSVGNNVQFAFGTLSPTITMF